MNGREDLCHSFIIDSKNKDLGFDIPEIETSA
jgi:hypothetical protein